MDDAKFIELLAFAGAIAWAAWDSWLHGRRRSAITLCSLAGLIVCSALLGWIASNRVLGALFFVGGAGFLLSIAGFGKAAKKITGRDNPITRLLDLLEAEDRMKGPDLPRVRIAGAPIVRGAAYGTVGSEKKGASRDSSRDPPVLDLMLQNGERVAVTLLLPNGSHPDHGPHSR